MQDARRGKASGEGKEGSSVARFESGGSLAGARDAPSVGQRVGGRDGVTARRAIRSEPYKKNERPRRARAEPSARPGPRQRRLREELVDALPAALAELLPEADLALAAGNGQDVARERPGEPPDRVGERLARRQERRRRPWARGRRARVDQDSAVLATAARRAERGSVKWQAGRRALEARGARGRRT